jgi:hypothetical protein
MRRIVTGAPPEPVSNAFAGLTMPMSVARIDLAGPTRLGSDE